MNDWSKIPFLDKLILFLFSFLISQSQVYSQITITQSELMQLFTPGNLIYHFEGGDGPINIGNMNGSNIYDFSQISFQDSIIINNYFVSQIPLLAQRYNNNASTLGEGIQNIVKNPIILQDNNSTFFIGKVTIESEYSFEYYTPHKLFTNFPLTFNPPASNFSQWIHVVDTTYNLNWQIKSVSSYSEIVDVWIDGYGIIKLPGFSLECLRMTRSQSWYGEKSIYYLTREGLMFIVDNVSASSPDTGIVNGHYYILKSSTFVSVDDIIPIAAEFSLYQNYPNPFNPSTKIRYSIPTSPLNPSPYQGEGHRERFITLKVYDILGNEIATLVNEYKPAGSYEVEFNSHSDEGQNLSSGIYFYQLKAGSFVQTKKMLLLK